MACNCTSVLLTRTRDRSVATIPELSSSGMTSSEIRSCTTQKKKRSIRGKEALSSHYPHFDKNSPRRVHPRRQDTAAATSAGSVVCMKRCRISNPWNPRISAMALAAGWVDHARHWRGGDKNRRHAAAAVRTVSCTPLQAVQGGGNKILLCFIFRLSFQVLGAQAQQNLHQSPIHGRSHIFLCTRWQPQQIISVEKPTRCLPSEHKNK